MVARSEVDRYSRKKESQTSSLAALCFFVTATPLGSAAAAFVALAARTLASASSTISSHHIAPCRSS
eukprot:5168636-Prymnesium_polylepis.1